MTDIGLSIFLHDIDHGSFKKANMKIITNVLYKIKNVLNK